MAKPTLVSIAYSPWSRRAKKALDRQGIEYRLQSFLPGAGEPMLRARLRKPFGKVTVPVLFTDDGPLMDSTEIAYWASDRSDTPLAPPRLRPIIDEWVARAEDALMAGRLRTTTLIRADRDALRSSLPSAVRPLGPLGMLIASDLTRRLLTKYADERTMSERNAVLDDYVQTLESALENGPHLAGEPSYADLAAASGLAFIGPDARAPIPPEARPHWTRADLVEKHPKVFAWCEQVWADSLPVGGA